MHGGYLMNEKPERYAMCCGLPLISTLLFSGAEWYCSKCCNTYGFFDVPRVADATPKIKAQNKALADKFHELSKSCVPRGCYMKDCARCKANDGDHTAHLTDDEALASGAAYKKLFNEGIEL